MVNVCFLCQPGMVQTAWVCNAESVFREEETRLAPRWRLLNVSQPREKLVSSSRYLIKLVAIWNQSCHSDESCQREMQFYLSYNPLFFFHLPTNGGPVHVVSVFAALWLPDLATVRGKKQTAAASLAVPSTCLSIWPLCIFTPGSFKTGWVISVCPLFFPVQWETSFRLPLHSSGTGCTELSVIHSSFHFTPPVSLNVCIFQSKMTPTPLTTS